MDENQHRKYDIRLRCLTILGALIAFVFSVVQYTDTKEKEFISKYWNEQVNLCHEGSDYATKLVIDIDTAIKQKDIDELYRITFGRGRLYLADAPLETLRAIMQLASMCKAKSNKDEKCNSHHFNSRALLFVQQCRDMISESWSKPLHTINDGRKWIYN